MPRRVAAVAAQPRVAALLGLTLAGSVAFGDLAEDMATGDPLVRFDARVALSVLRLPDSLTDTATVVTLLGSPLVLVAVAAVAVLLLWRRGARLQALYVAAAVVGSGGLVTQLKHLFHRHRPPYLTTEHSYSFPSGHATTSAAVYFALAWVIATRLPRTWQRVAVVAGAFVLSALIAASRVALDAHYVSDVVAGLAVGTALAASLALVLELATRRR